MFYAIVFNNSSREIRNIRLLIDSEGQAYRRLRNALSIFHELTLVYPFFIAPCIFLYVHNLS